MTQGDPEVTQKMQKMRFTKANLDGLELPDGQDELTVQDAVIPGLHFRVRRTRKVFTVRRKLDGRVTRVTLGAYPDMTIDQARKLALETLSTLAGGDNPNALKRAKRAKSVTLAEVLDQYIESRRNLRPATVTKYRQLVRDYLGDWADRPLKNITRDAVERRHRLISESGETAANSTMRVLRALFEFAHGAFEDEQGEPLFLHNPVKRLSHVRAWNKETRRTTIIKPHDFATWFEAVASLPDWYGGNDPQTFRDYLLFVAFTGLRRREAAAIRWDWIDRRQGVLTIPAEVTKNGHAHALPLSGFLVEILNRRPEGVFVFPSPNSASGHISEPHKAVEAVRNRTGVAFTIHDLRRGFITTAESVGVAGYTLKRLLNHRDKADVTDGYLIVDVERLRVPMQQVTDRLLLLSRGVADNVVVGEFGRVAL